VNNLSKKQIIIINMLFLLGFMVSGSLVAKNIIDIQKHRNLIERHPERVINEALSLKSDINEMMVNIKNITLNSQNKDVDKLKQNHLSIKTKINTTMAAISEHYLGPSVDIDNLKRSVNNSSLEWGVLKSLNRKHTIGDLLDIYNIEKEWTQDVNNHLNVILNFAYSKLEKSNQQYKYSKSALKISVLISSAIIFFYTILGGVFIKHRTHHYHLALNEKSTLIDDNIAIAKLDDDFRVLEVNQAMINLTGNVKPHEEAYLSPIAAKTRWLADEIKASIHSQGFYQQRVDFPNENLHLVYKITPANENSSRVKYINIIDNISDRVHSTTDPLTGILNRRAFEADTNALFEADSHPFISVAIIDVDHFKQYNDIYGHPSGDKCLKLIANELKTSLRRASDHVYRIGGEEFAIVTVSQDLNKTMNLLNHIKNKIEALHIEHSGNSVSDYATISIGGFIYQQHSLLTLKEVYGFADKLLYEAKKTRNRVVCALAEPDQDGVVAQI
jgi:diguanylate cyclase (GGDEF)-like protein